MTSHMLRNTIRGLDVEQDTIGICDYLLIDPATPGVWMASASIRTTKLPGQFSLSASGFLHLLFEFIIFVNVLMNNQNM